MTIDIEKAFDSLDHTFQISILEKFRSGETSMYWIKIFFHGQESCVVNGKITTKYFKLEKGAWHGDPMSAYFLYIV